MKCPRCFNGCSDCQPPVDPKPMSEHDEGCPQHGKDHVCNGETFLNTTNYDEAIRFIICAKYGYGNNVEDLKMALVHIQDEIRDLEGRPDPNQKDLFNQSQGENNVEEK